MVLKLADEEQGANCSPHQVARLLSGLACLAALAALNLVVIGRIEQNKTAFSGQQRSAPRGGLPRRLADGAIVQQAAASSLLHLQWGSKRHTMRLSAAAIILQVVTAAQQRTCIGLVRATAVWRLKRRRHAALLLHQAAVFVTHMHAALQTCVQYGSPDCRRFAASPRRAEAATGGGGGAHLPADPSVAAVHASQPTCSDHLRLLYKPCGALQAFGIPFVTSGRGKKTSALLSSRSYTCVLRERPRPLTQRRKLSGAPLSPPACQLGAFPGPLPLPPPAMERGRKHHNLRHVLAPEEQAAALAKVCGGGPAAKLADAGERILLGKPPLHTIH